MKTRIKTSTERQREYRAKMERNGFRKITLWVHKDDESNVKIYAKKLKALRS